MSDCVPACLSVFACLSVCLSVCLGSKHQLTKLTSGLFVSLLTSVPVAGFFFFFFGGGASLYITFALYITVTQQETLLHVKKPSGSYNRIDSLIKVVFTLGNW